MTTPAQVLSIAASQLGTTEHPPDSNRVLYSRWYAGAVADPAFAAAPWCAMYVSWVFDQAGASELVAAQNAHGFAWCPAGVAWFSRRGALATTPRPGDVVFYDWHGDRVADHVGLVEQVGDGVITALEGNTSRDERGSQSNGGGVFRRVRSLRTVRGFGRPAYGTAAVPEPALRLGDAGAAVRAWQAVLLRWRAGCLPVAGADGDFGPETETATRALQAAGGVPPDGVVGPATRAAAERLLSPSARTPAAAAPPLLRVLRRGDRGTDVKALQARLAERGWALAADGDFGPATHSVVRQYQAEKGLGVDGVVGPVTWLSVFTAPVTA